MIHVDIRKQLGPFSLDVTFSAGNETVVLFGHSGSGKSLTLAAIAGLVRPDAGEITIDGVSAFDRTRGITLPPQRRGVGYVVQDLALFPHLTAAQNVGYGLTGMDRASRRARVASLMTLLDLDGLEKRLPSQMSGGQQQRVALARALAPEPRVLLLDEPFSALDAQIRDTLRRELIRLKEQLDLTIVFVTHDLREAYALADQLVVFDGGRVVDAGPRDRVFHAPASRRAADLTEFRNVLSGVVEERHPDGLVVRVGGLPVRTHAAEIAPGTTVDLCVRPERIPLIRREPPPQATETHLHARIIEETAHGAAHYVRFQVDESELCLEVEIPARPYEVLGVAERRRWWLQLQRDCLHVIPRPASAVQDHRAAPDSRAAAPEGPAAPTAS